MTQRERRIYLIKYLLNENEDYKNISVPADEAQQKTLLRSLFNVRMPKAADENFISVQNDYLQCELERKGITDYKSLSPVKDGVYLWQGDITTLKCGAIVNAANSQMLGCFVPCHGCIDNAVHTAAGIQLRSECDEIMARQGREEPVGSAKITGAYNLPCDYVIHTVGPYISSFVAARDKALLSSCYLSCLRLADEYAVGSVAFCCISTGEFHFPNKTAAQLAVAAVEEYKKNTGSKTEVIFNVFKDKDREIYEQLLRAD